MQNENSFLELWKYPKCLMSLFSQELLDCIVDLISCKNICIEKFKPDEILTACMNQGVFTALAKKILSDEELKKYFAEFVTDIKKNYLNSIAAYTIFEQELYKILTTLSESDISVIPIKGCALWLKFKIEPALRGLVDFDLLCRKKDLCSADKKIVELDYGEWDDKDWHCFQRVRGNHLVYMHENPMFPAVELHHHLYDDQPADIVEIIMTNLESVTFRDKKIPFLSTNDLLIISAHHFLLEIDTMDLRRIFDFYYFARNCQDFDELANRAIEVWNEPLTLLITLKTAQRIFSTPFPPETERKLALSLKNLERKIYLKFLKSGFKEITKLGVFYAIWKSRKQGRRERSLPRLLFPMPGLVVHEYKLPRTHKFFLLYRLKYMFFRLSIILRKFLPSK